MTAQNIIDHIKTQIGCTLTNCASFGGKVKIKAGKKYAVFMIEPQDYLRIKRICSEKSTLKSIQPSGLNRVAIFI